MKKPRIIFFIMMIATFCFSCDKTSDLLEEELTVLPGECLSSSVLSFTGLSINDNTGPKGFVLTCEFSMSDIITPAGAPYSSSDFKRVPKDEVYEFFGANAELVKKSYDDFWNDCFIDGTLSGGGFGVSTIVYESGMTLIADKDFAGFKAGENITANAKGYQKGNDTPVILDCVFPSDYLSLPNDGGYYLPSYGVTIRIPLEGYSVVDEDVTFSLSVPVKVGLLLTWFNDRIVDPNAPYSYREDILSCSFTVNKGLH